MCTDLYCFDRSGLYRGRLGVSLDGDILTGRHEVDVSLVSHTAPGEMVTRSPVSSVQLSPSASDFQTHVPYSFLSIALLSLPWSTSVLLRPGTQSLANATPPWSRPSSSHRASRKLRVLERSCCSLRQSRPLSRNASHPPLFRFFRWRSIQILCRS